MEKNVIGRIGIIDRLLLKLSWLFEKPVTVIEEAQTTLEEKQLYQLAIENTVFKTEPKPKRPYKESLRDSKVLQIVRMYPNNNASAIGKMYRQAMGYKKYNERSTGSDHSSRSLKRLLDSGKVKKNDKNQYSIV